MNNSSISPTNVNQVLSQIARLVESVTLRYSEQSFNGFKQSCTEIDGSISATIRGQCIHILDISIQICIIYIILTCLFGTSKRNYLVKILISQQNNGINGRNTSNTAVNEDASASDLRISPLPSGFRQLGVFVRGIRMWYIKGSPGTARISDVYIIITKVGK